ncbi:cytochrome P450 [Ilyonectria sp. MPI-CAGE-AT-0026]|nr:cytochrome P450 [Ilyonectria sp. MPI-CAGE-AT-0026]
MLAFTNPDAVPEVVASWAQKFGKVFYTKMGGTDYIWLSSPQAVKDLMDKRSSKYSTRPVMPVAGDTASGGLNPFFMPYGQHWRAVRKYMHSALNLNTSQTYRPIQDFESKQVLFDIVDKPEDFYDHNRRYSASVTMLCIYGRRIANWDDPTVTEVYEALNNFAENSSPGKWIVDAFPSLAALPEIFTQRWRTRASKAFDYDLAVWLKLWRRLVAEIEDGTAPECFGKHLYLANPSKDGIDESGAAFIAGGMIEAGTDSTSTTINNWILCCLLFPEALKKAQEELDRVVGRDRMPTFEDEPNLPYMRAMVRETVRFRPFTKFGINHAVSEDDWYDGKFIPKDSVIMLNWWAIHNDPEIYPDPKTYNPERFLNFSLTTAEGINANDVTQRDHFGYGAGRRICPGIHVAQNSLFINMARVAWAFNITKARDSTNNIIEPATDWLPGLFSTPVKFKANLQPRSPKHAKIIRDSWAQAQRDGLNWNR